MSCPTEATPRLDRRQLRAPAENGRWLVLPEWEQLPQLVQCNQQQLQAQGGELAGVPLARLRSEARRQLLEAAWHYTRQYRDADPPGEPQAVLLAGHQPELFHPGVWFKNAVLDAAARRVGAAAVNLVIDSDVMHRTLVPAPAGDRRHPRRAWVELDRPLAEEVPLELRRVADAECFTSFGTRLAQTVRSLVPRPLVEAFWPVVLERFQATGHLGAALAQGRHAWEGLWGWQTLELPQSRVCSLPAFAYLVAHLVWHAPEFHRVYNQAVLDYRRRKRLRSRTHPSPLLGREQDWYELPFWTYTRREPVRRGLWVRRAGAALELSDRAGWHEEAPAPRDGSFAALAERLHHWQQQGRWIRTRALLTTLWARLVLGDVFLHGIGGAKYDEVTEQIAREFFRLGLPEPMVATATVWLPGARRTVTAEQLGRLKHLLHQLQWQPERFLPAELQRRLPPELQRLLEEKQRLLAESSSPARHERLEALRRQLLRWVEPRRRQLEAQLAQLEQRREAESVLAYREYPFCVFEERTLRDFFLAFPPRSA